MLAVPLLSDFHVESAILVSLAGCFWAGWKASGRGACRGNEFKNPIRILAYLYLFGLPLFTHALLSNCLSIHGLGFWVLYPVPSVFFGYAIGRLLRKLGLQYCRVFTLIIIASTAFGILMAEFMTLPQVYFFNHVWGGWPGPIYDETIQLTGSIFYYRGITILWILLLWFIPDFGRDNQTNIIVAASALALVLSYTQLSEWGVISPNTHIQNRLGGEERTLHFNIYYDKGHYTPAEVRQIALEHEFYLDQIADTLKLDKPDSTHKIESYLYAHPWQKKQLTGAKYTSYVPVWLDEDQLHIARQQIASSLKHELVHVLAKQFGNSLINASWSIGLVEGLATALAPSRSKNTTIDQVVVSERPLPSAEEMEKALSPVGFYWGRSNVNYITSGSFVSYLIENYPVGQFKKAYKSGDVSSAYEQSFQTLVDGWHHSLENVEVDSVDQQIARRLFSIPSLFEQKCPHLMSGFARAWDNYKYHIAEGDTLKGLEALDRARSLQPENLYVKSEWAYENLKRENLEPVQFASTLADSSLDLQLLYADAFALADQYQVALTYVSRGIAFYDSLSDPSYEEAIATRTNKQQWEYYLDLTYRNRSFNLEEFSKLYYRTKIRALQKEIEEGNTEKVKAYSVELVELPVDTLYFDAYIELIHHLALDQQFELANRWIEKVQNLSLRSRYSERLNQEKSWIHFLQERDEN